MNVPDTGERSANGRPLTRLRIDPSWNDAPGQTNSLVYNAVSGAVNGWNAATNSSGHGAYYEIKFDSTTQQASSGNNIIIVKDSKLAEHPRGTAAGADYTSGNPGGPYTIHLRSDTTSACSLAALLEKIEQEIGHIYGLNHNDGSRQQNNCPPNAETIMNSPSVGNGSCSHVSNRSITQRDVETILQRQSDAVFRTGNCKGKWKNLAQDISDSGGCQEDPNCDDGCGQDPCCGDPCCGDPYCGDLCHGDPNCGVTCYEVCVTYCYNACEVWDEYGDCYYYAPRCDTVCSTQCY